MTGDRIAELSRLLAEESAGRQRAQTLFRALYETASDIAAIQDVEGVLAAIVQRTRAMTGVDMAYLSINDHVNGETFIRKSDGVRTEAYRSIRMPLGTGVLGKAATGLTMVSTTDYLDDPKLVHLAEIDRIVRAEGVRSILGVPMIVHGRVQGALLVADRTSLEYTAETIEIVDTIARQAAVAIDYTARLERLNTALHDLGEQQDADLKRVKALEGLLDLDRRMVDIVVRREGIEPLLGLISSVYGVRAQMIWEGDLPKDRLLSTALRSVTAAGLPMPVTLGTGPATVAPVAVGQRHFGWLAVHGTVPPDRRDLLERTALNVAMSLLIDEIEVSAEQRSQRELFDDLLSGHARLDGSTRTRLTGLGIDARKPLWIVAASGMERPEDHTSVVRKAIGGSGLVTVHGQHICSLHDRPESLSRAVLSAVRQHDPQVKVSAARVTAVGELARGHRSVEIALAALRVLGGSLLDADSLGSVGLLLAAEEEGRLPRTVTQAATPLLDYDTRSGTALTATAWTWLEFGPHLAEVAAQLFIHPNTLRQRLQRIATLLGDGWDSGHGRLDLHIALRALMIQRELQLVDPATTNSPFDESQVIVRVPQPRAERLASRPANSGRATTAAPSS